MDNRVITKKNYPPLLITISQNIFNIFHFCIISIKLVILLTIQTPTDSTYQLLIFLVNIEYLCTNRIAYNSLFCLFSGIYLRYQKLLENQTSNSTHEGCRVFISPPIITSTRFFELINRSLSVII